MSKKTIIAFSNASRRESWEGQAEDESATAVPITAKKEKTMDDYQAPEDFWEVKKNLTFEKHLEVNDPLFIPTDSARGDTSFNDLLKELGIKQPDYQLKSAPETSYTVFCGHTGCGKSTELRTLKDKLQNPDAYLAILVDIMEERGTARDLHYVDVLMALAKKLLERLKEEKIEIHSVFMTNLENWFKEKIVAHKEIKDLEGKVKTGVKGGLPGLLKIFASITAAFRYKYTYAETLRLVIKNNFSEFADNFNQLLTAAEAEIIKAGLGKKLLFIVDGTDRLEPEDRKRFFIHDADQLKLVKSTFVYCAPIDLLYEGNQVRQRFDAAFILPMIKIRNRFSDERVEEVYEVLRKLVLQRIHRDLFDSEETIDYLIDYSGGNPRHLVMLLNYAFLSAEKEMFDRRAAEKAVRKLAVDFSRFLNGDDYEALYTIDKAEDQKKHNSEETRKLLYNLALLEYNEYWWSSHPVIRTLEIYRNMENEAG